MIDASSMSEVSSGGCRIWREVIFWRSAKQVTNEVGVGVSGSQVMVGVSGAFRVVSEGLAWRWR